MGTLAFQPKEGVNMTFSPLIFAHPLSVSTSRWYWLEIQDRALEKGEGSGSSDKKQQRECGMNYLAKGKKTRGQGVLIEHGVSLLCVGHFIHLLAPSIDRSESREPVGTICPVLSFTPFSTHSIHQRA